MRAILLSFAFGALLFACSDDGGTGTTDSTICTPTTCQAQSKNCGTMPDGCGASIQCGSCSGSETCGGGGVANVCGAGSTCTPTTCAAQGKDCGLISDGCSDVLSCGSCTAPKTCGGSGLPNVCGAKADASTHDSTVVDANKTICDPTCMAQAGAVCCTQCGCAGTVKCTPVCEKPFSWDCEMRCCFNYSTYKCY